MSRDYKREYGQQFSLNIIPRIIHQTWREVSIPTEWTACVQGWKQLHPEWEHKMWTDEDNRSLIKNEYPWFLATYDSYPHNIQKASAAKYFILHKYGGVYADIDMQCLVTLNSLLNQYTSNASHTDIFIAGYCDSVRRMVGDAIICCSPGHPLFNVIFQELLSTASKSNPESLASVLETTGNKILNYSVELYKQKYAKEYSTCPVYILKSTIFYPISATSSVSTSVSTAPKQLGTRRKFPSSWTVHHWAATWHKEPKQIITVESLYAYIPRNTHAQGHGIVERSLLKHKTFLPRLQTTWMSIAQMHEHDKNNNKMTCIMTGAYNGYLLSVMAKLSNIVYAYEGRKHPIDCLKFTLRANDVQNVVHLTESFAWSHNTTLFQSAPLDIKKPHMLCFRESPPSGLGSGLAMGVDDHLYDRLTELDLIHIDAQGEELHVLRGSAHLIQKFRPVITIKIWTDEIRKEHGIASWAQQTFDALEQLGYNFIELIEQNTYIALC